MECLLPYLSMVTVPHIMVGLERMLDYRGVRLLSVEMIMQYRCNIHEMWVIERVNRCTGGVYTSVHKLCSRAW